MSWPKNAEYDLSKKLYDFEAYASKKHAVYPELYSLLFEPWIELSLFRHKFDLHIAHSKKDLDRDTLKSRFNDELHPIVQKLPNVSKYFYKNELYLSKNATAAYNEAFKELADLAANIYLNFRKNSRNDNWQDPSFSLIDIDEEELQRAERKINILKEIIYKELSYTHSEEI